ncbi:MAG: transcription termination factor NusA [Erysipelotrichaceae bacterium]|nr:transcription termination factor NusA [Erysipelotrichaceae bacterium]MDY5251338.1 transcription termination factor NusA [Erysipelotrichaceae bacterium]
MDKLNELLKAMSLIEDDRKIPKEIVVEALKEAMAKAYKKHVEIPDINVRVDITPKGKIEIYQQYTVVEEVEDDELEISLEDARVNNVDAQIGDIVEHKVEINNFSRAAATLAKSVVKQKIREAEKQAIYDEYIDKLDEMVLGMVETVEEKFALVNLGKTLAILPKSQQVPTEKLKEGEKIRVVITEVNRETKKSQVTVSRSDALLVKRLFEKEVPEIYNGIVEIKAIAREAGERCKIAVVSHNPDVDPIGACIGPRGSRVQEIINEIHGEKIDIFEWNDDIANLVGNALAPAVVKAVIPSEDNKSVLVVVDDNQLSLAIGRKGKNARLAVKLINKKIDIKTEAELAENGVDYQTLLLNYQAQQEKLRRQKALEAAANEESDEMTDEAVKVETVVETGEAEPTVTATENMESCEDVEDDVPAETEETTSSAMMEETKEETSKQTSESDEAKVEKRRKVKLEKKADEYVSKFEKLVDSSKKQEQTTVKRRKKKDDDDRRLRAKDILSHIDVEYDNRPVYSEEELEEIRLREEAEMNQYDVDYDEFEEYYDED